MLAVPERVPNYSLNIPDELIWHKPVGRGGGDFQAIACGDEDEGIVLPGPKQEVPLRIRTPHQRWCADCLVIVRKGA